jgi:hypothetical protein
MINHKTLKSLSTTTLLVVLSLSMYDLTSAAYATETANDNKEPNKTSLKTTKHEHHKLMKEGHGSHMNMDMKGMVMNENKDKIPKDCTEISEDVTIEVNAGVKYAKPFPGTVFGFNEHQWHVKPCARITVEFTNDDDIRHQWMIHGLPTYLYPKGMFHIEVNGPGKRTGTFIVPSSHFTYLVHCDIAQHTEKGMKAQLKVGNGREDLPSIPGISNPTFPNSFVQKPL